MVTLAEVRRILNIKRTTPNEVSPNLAVRALNILSWLAHKHFEQSMGSQVPVIANFKPTSFYSEFVENYYLRGADVLIDEGFFDRRKHRIPNYGKGTEKLFRTIFAELGVKLPNE